MFKMIGVFFMRVHMYVHNTLNHIRWSLVCDSLNSGRKRILSGGAWIDKDGNLYNCCGHCVGKVEFIRDNGAH